MTKLDIHNPGSKWEDFSRRLDSRRRPGLHLRPVSPKKIHVTQLSISFPLSRIYDARARGAWCPTREGVFGDVAWRCKHGTSDLSLSAAVLALLFLTDPAAASPFFFSTGNPDGKIATATRPESAGKFEIESADDFVLTGPTRITSATFTGLITGATAANIGEVRIEIYRVFPADSNVARTSGPPTFS